MRSTIVRSGGECRIAIEERSAAVRFYLRRTWTTRRFSSGKRSRTIARTTLPTKPVPPKRSIVLFAKASIAEISPVPSIGTGSPVSYSPRTAFHRQLVSAFIRPPSLVSEKAETSRRPHAIRESANSFVPRRAATGAWDLSQQGIRRRRASERQPNCRKKRKTAQDQYPRARHIHEHCGPFRSPPTRAEGLGLWQCGL